MIFNLVAVIGLACVIAGAFLIALPVGLIALGAALIYLVLVNRPEGDL